MATTVGVHSSQRQAPNVGSNQICPPNTSPTGSELRVSDKENGMENALHREIMDKLKHDSVGAALHADSQLLAEHLASYQKRLTGVGDGHMAAQANEFLRREALLSLQSIPKLDYFRLAALQDQHTSILAAAAAQRNAHSPVRTSHSPSGSEDGADSMSPNHAPSAGGQWTYEEQFKQLYELGDEPDRREFLDELFAFMQKRGTPVNRIPIMAKQTLDMFKLFKLVVSKGGLVEVINKKLWREITKGLNLPSSITSAAFTLRTQYMKYIYPYECEKFDFSKPPELQAAIDGNRREGRRPGYGFDMTSPNALPHFFSPQSFPTANPFFNPTMMNNPMASILSNQMNGYMNGNGLGAPMNHPRLSAPITSPNAPPLEAEDRSQSPIDVSNPVHTPTQSAFSRPEPVTSDYDSHQNPPKRRRLTPNGDSERRSPPQNTQNTQNSMLEALADSKRVPHSSPSNHHSEAEMSPVKRDPTCSRKSSASPSHHISSTHIKISSTKSDTDGDVDEKSSVAVSMEVNGILYQGVLFAQK